MLFDRQRGKGTRRVARGTECSDDAKMADHVYRVTEIVGSSEQGVDDAIRRGIARATDTLREVDWFEVTEIRGHVENGHIGHFQVGMKVGFRLESS